MPWVVNPNGPYAAVRSPVTAPDDGNAIAAAVTPATGTASQTRRRICRPSLWSGSTSTPEGGLLLGRLPAVAPGRLESGPAGLQTSDRHPERRARHVVEPGVVEEVDRLGVAAVLAAHP